MARSSALAGVARPSRESLARGVLALLVRALPTDSGVELALAGDRPTRDTLARLVFSSPGALGRALWPPTPDAMGDAYLRGDFDIEGDIAALARAGTPFDLGRLAWSERAALLRDVLRLRRDAGAATALTRCARLRGRRHSVARDRTAVRFHYDVGNAFYTLWLDRRMTYSCAYFGSPETELADAQEAKLDLVCRKLALRPGQRLLDIGCGWGSLIVYAAQRYGVEAVGVTLSDKQAREADAQAREARVADRVRAFVLDYRELARLGSFDAVASIGMFEHVGSEKLRDYFAASYRALRPGGLFLNHGIAAVERSRGPLPRVRLSVDFVGRHVFPDGELVTIAEATDQARSSGFAVVYRTWRLYMAGARVGFERGERDVAQMLLERPSACALASRPLLPWW
jgi:cyclopropane-fatty-acyl-phospholipid synthase